LLFAPFLASGAQTAQARLYCLSLRFQPATTTFGNTLQLTSLAPNATPNGELAPDFDPTSPHSHLTGFLYDDVTVFETIYGAIAFSIVNSDANQNGYTDFFEVSQGVSGTVDDGAYVMFDDSGQPFDTGSVRATWSRAAGSKDGTCVLRLTSSGFGSLGDYTHAFELIEYRGPLDYTPGTNQVSGALQMTREGATQNRIAGPIEFTKVAANPLNELDLRPGVWTNTASESLTFSVTNRFDRDATNYFGFVDFDDGDLNTVEPDYLTWGLSIDDANDSDSDGVPDFSDSPASTPPPRAPALVLMRDVSGFLLGISGTVGRAHEVQEVSSLGDTNWNMVLSVTLTNDPQIVTLPPSTSATRFWRVWVP